MIVAPGRLFHVLGSDMRQSGSLAGVRDDSQASRSLTRSILTRSILTRSILTRSILTCSILTCSITACLTLTCSTTCLTLKR